MSASLKLTLKVKQMLNYGMFSDEGNNAVRLIVQNAKTYNLRWIDVYRELQDLSDLEGYGEAMDTAVREIVYDALAYKDNFYDV
jgi:hypothetical protein